jgi:hypothetical protein
VTTADPKARRVVGQKPSPDVQAAVKAEVLAAGVTAVAKRVGASPTTILRIMAGQPVYPGSLLLVCRAFGLETFERPEVQR